MNIFCSSVTSYRRPGVRLTWRGECEDNDDTLQ